MAGIKAAMEMLNREPWNKAISTIDSGGLVVIATETFYCVAANPFNEEAVRRIFLLKTRPLDKPLPLIASTFETVSGVISEKSRDSLDLAAQFWPGSLTILINLKVQFSNLLRGARERVGVRIPPQCPAVRLAAEAGGWITATSANLSGGPNASVIEEIPQALLSQVDCIVDTGRSPGGEPSTVMALEDGEIVIYRPGAVSAESLKKSLKSVSENST